MSVRIFSRTSRRVFLLDWTACRHICHFAERPLPDSLRPWLLGSLYVGGKTPQLGPFLAARNWFMRHVHISSVCSALVLTHPCTNLHVSGPKADDDEFQHAFKEHWRGHIKQHSEWPFLFFIHLSHSLHWRFIWVPLTCLNNLGWNGEYKWMRIYVHACRSRFISNWTEQQIQILNCWNQTMCICKDGPLVSTSVTLWCCFSTYSILSSLVFLVHSETN